MKKHEVIDLILANGSSTQKYIVSRDILSVDKTSPQMVLWQDQILNSKEVRKILKSQNSDGWFGIYLHGGAGGNLKSGAMDGAIARFRELGLEMHYDFITKAKQALYADEYPTKYKRSYPPVDVYNFSRAETLANMHIDGEEPDELLVKFQNQLIDKFRRGANVDSIDEVAREIKSAKFAGGWAYLPGKDFPWPSDFIVLGSSLNWKTTAAANVITSAMENIARLAPIPAIFDIVNGHYVGPICGYSDLDLYDDCCDIPKGHIVFWLRVYNFLCKIADVRQIPHYFRQGERLAERISDDSLIDNLTENALDAIESTYGFSGKWTSETHRKTDIYYKALQILHSAGIDF